MPVDDELLLEVDAAEEEFAAAEEVDVCEAVAADVVAPDTDDDNDDKDDDDDVVADVVEADVLVEPEEVDIDDPTVCESQYTYLLLLWDKNTSTSNYGLSLGWVLTRRPVLVPEAGG